MPSICLAFKYKHTIYLEINPKEKKKKKKGFVVICGGAEPGNLSRGATIRKTFAELSKDGFRWRDPVR